MLTCPRCGSENPAGSRFCNACGAELGAAAAEGRGYRKVVKGNAVMTERTRRLLDELGAGR